MARFVRRRKFCRFSAEGASEIDYKDLDTLRAMFQKQEKLYLVELLVLKRVISVSFQKLSSALAI